jgi:hypothetical protein
VVQRFSHPPELNRNLSLNLLSPSTTRAAGEECGEDVGAWNPWCSALVDGLWPLLKLEITMTDAWDGMRWTNLGGDLDEMEVIGNTLFQVGVHVDSDPEFKAYILAAGAAHSVGNRSVDNVLRRHLDEWVRRFERESAEAKIGTEGLYRRISAEASRRCEAISKLDLRDCLVAGTLAAANAQIRLRSTFRAALVTIRVGYAFEAEAIIRLGLEQVAWSYGVRNLGTFEQVESTRGTGWITPLKEVLPGVGLMYNRLTNLAHMAPATHERFLERSAENIFVKLKNPAAALESTHLLLILLDAFLIVSEICFQAAGLVCENIDQSSRTPLEKRTARGLASEFAAILPPTRGASIESWWK